MISCIDCLFILGLWLTNATVFAQNDLELLKKYDSCGTYQAHLFTISRTYPEAYQHCRYLGDAWSIVVNSIRYEKAYEDQRNFGPVRKYT